MHEGRGRPRLDPRYKIQYPLDYPDFFVQQNPTPLDVRLVDTHVQLSPNQLNLSAKIQLDVGLSPIQYQVYSLVITLCIGPGQQDLANDALFWSCFEHCTSLYNSFCGATKYK